MKFCEWLGKSKEKPEAAFMWDAMLVHMLAQRAEKRYLEAKLKHDRFINNRYGPKPSPTTFYPPIEKQED